MLHLPTNIRYVFDCNEWLDKRCKNERLLAKPWVQQPPVQSQDWRVTEVYPAQVRCPSTHFTPALLVLYHCLGADL